MTGRVSDNDAASMTSATESYCAKRCSCAQVGMTKRTRPTFHPSSNKLGGNQLASSASPVSPSGCWPWGNNATKKKVSNQFFAPDEPTQRAHGMSESELTLMEFSAKKSVNDTSWVSKGARCASKGEASLTGPLSSTTKSVPAPSKSSRAAAKTKACALYLVTPMRRAMDTTERPAQNSPESHERGGKSRLSTPPPGKTTWPG